MLKYGDKVRIKEGFYRNCYGILIDCKNEYIDLMTGDKGDFVYTIEINQIDENNCYRTKEIQLKENQIEKLKEE